MSKYDYVPRENVYCTRCCRNFFGFDNPMRAGNTCPECEQKKQREREIIENFPCTKCNARLGEPCLTHYGESHRCRVRAARRAEQGKSALTPRQCVDRALTVLAVFSVIATSAGGRLPFPWDARVMIGGMSLMVALLVYFLTADFWWKTKR
jgi:hypothetical protein